MTSPVGCTRRAIRFFTGPLRQRPDTGLPDRHRHGLPRTGDRLVAFGARCPGCLLRLTGASSRPRVCTPSTARSARVRISSYRLRFHSPNPVGLRFPRSTIAGGSASPTPFLGPGRRALSGTKHTVHPAFPLVKRYFRCSQGYPPECAVSHRSFLFIHRMHTGCSQVAR